MSSASDTLSAHADPLDSVADRAHEEGASSGDDRGGRAFRLSVAVLLAFALSLGLSILTTPVGADATANAPRLGGDFPAFFGAGSIVLDGDIGDLFEAGRQTQAQEGLGVDGYLSFAYAPHVAVAYAPFAALGYRLGYAVHTVLLIGVLAASLRMLWPLVPTLQRHSLPAFAAAMAFYPLFRAVGGGQNTALTVLVFAVVWRALHDDREAVAGLAAGLLLFRPQYALPLIGLMWLAGHRRATLIAGAIGVVTWSFNAVFMGVAWLPEWFDAVTPFVERDADVNASNSISIVGFTQALFGDGRVTLVLAAAAVLVVIGVLMYLWANPDRYSLAVRMAAAAAGTLLLSPHTMYYDAGLLVIVAAAWLATHGSAALRGVAILWVASLAHLAAPTLGATPLAIVVVAAFVVTVHPGFSTRMPLGSVS